MVLKLNNFCGFETQGPEEAQTFNTIAFDTTTQRTGSASLLLDNAADIFNLPWLANGATTGGPGYVIGFGFKKTTDAAVIIMNIRDDSGTFQVFNIVTGSDGKMFIRDAFNTTLDTAAVAFNDNQWYYIEIFAEFNSVAGDWAWFIDDVEEGSGSDADFNSGNLFSTTDNTHWNCLGAVSFDYELDDMYILSGATVDDRLGPCEVFGYQSGEDTTRTGTPTNGTFTETGDTPTVDDGNGTALEANGSSALTLVGDFDDGTNARVDCHPAIISGRLGDW